MTFKIKQPMLKMGIVLTICSTIFWLGFIVNNSPSEPVRQELQATSYQLVKAYTESPAIQIHVDTTDALIEKAQLINTTVIYDTNKGFVVYDSTQNIGYYYAVNTVAWFNVPMDSISIIVLFSCCLSPVIITGILILKYGEGD